MTEPASNRVEAYLSTYGRPGQVEAGAREHLMGPTCSARANDASPVSYELASTSKAEGIEDRATMAPFSARHRAEMADLGARVVTVELLVGAQATDLRPLCRRGRGTRDAYGRVRQLVPSTAPGEAPPDGLEPLVDAVRRGETALALMGTGPLGGAG